MSFSKEQKINYLGALMIIGVCLLNPMTMKQFVPSFPLLPGHEQLLWAIDAFFLPLGIILVLIPRIDKGWILSLVSILFMFGLLEGFLILYPEIAGQRFANIKLSKYHTLEDGIYIHVQEVQLNLMKPDFNAKMYFNGYFWDHQTDKYGFRNQRTMEEAEIVLIGDSFIYGHGVEQDETLGYYLEEKINKPVFNMARQGDFAYPQMYLLNKVGLNLSPKYIFYFFFENDISDAFSLYTERVDEFMKTPFDSLHFPDLPKTSVQIQSKSNTQSFKQKGFMVIRWFKLLQINRQKQPEKKEREKKDQRFKHLSTTSYKYFKGGDVEKKRKCMAYTKRAIQYMNSISEQNGATFVMVPIVHKSQQPLFDELELLSQQDSIPLINIQTFMFQEDRHLPRDFHFSPKGHKDLADVIANWIKENE